MATFRKGFLLTNGSGCYIVNRQQRNDIEGLIASGWKIGAIRPICTSMLVKLKNLPPEILAQKVYSYSLCILELTTAEGAPAPATVTGEVITEVAER
jgi:hypothetical protein